MVLPLTGMKHFSASRSTGCRFKGKGGFSTGYSEFWPPEHMGFVWLPVVALTGE